nr:TPA_asm: ATP synthase F0 subunit 8 [Euschistus heros]
MPQMSPLWWEMLFIIFILTYLVMTTLVYFIISPRVKISSNKKIKSSEMKWLW